MVVLATREVEGAVRASTLAACRAHFRGDAEEESLAWGMEIAGHPVWWWCQQLGPERYAQSTAEAAGFDLTEDDLAEELRHLISVKGRAPEVMDTGRSLNWRWRDGETFIFDRHPDVDSIPTLRFQCVSWSAATAPRPRKGFRPFKGLNGAAPIAPQEG